MEEIGRDKERKKKVIYVWGVRKRKRHVHTF